MTHSSDAVRRGPGLSDEPLWYKDAVIYEVRTRSFYDSNGDGIGDFMGLASKLDYLADLGITAIWVLPHYPSPSRDDGYDIADYTDIHQDVGTLEDFDELIEQAHRRGLRVITELVINHTSDAHPWFQRARRAKPGSVERDFYVWSETTSRYKDARIIFRDFEPSNWTWDPIAHAYYWHRFFSHQPDLNFENPAVHDAVLGVVDFWLARGVDGLRLDAVPYLYEAEGTNCENLPATHAFLKKLRAHVDAKFKGRMLLAEANQWPEDAAAYFGDGDECHMNFHFPIMPRLFMSIHMEDRFPIIDILRQTPELHPSCQWAMFLRNHDELTLEMVTDEERDYMYRAYARESQMRINLGIRRRLAPLTGNDRRKMELLNGLLFSMPGTPVIYYGDEIGMGDNVFLGDRNGVRTPMQWSADRNAGFSRANPQRLILPIIIDPEYHYEALNVEAQQSNANSLLWWMKRLIALRKQFRAFSRGTIEFLHPSNPRVLAFVRRYEDETVLVVANLARHVQVVELNLSEMKGAVPVELMGGTRFPSIGELPYMLTLGGYDFYWFHVRLPKPDEREERLSMHEAMSLSCTNLRELLFGGERTLLEEALASFLDAKGWLSGAVSQTRVVDVVRIGGEERTNEGLDGKGGITSRFVTTLVRVEYREGESETFALTLQVVTTVASTDAKLSSAFSLPRSRTAVANLYFQDTSSEGPIGALVEATNEDTARAMFGTLVGTHVLRGRSGKLVGKVFPGSDLENADRELRVLQSSRFGAVVTFGTSYVMRLFYHVEEGPAPEVEVGNVLRAQGVKDLAPAVLGQVEYGVARAEPTTVAILESYVINEGTAWQQARSEIARAYDRALARPQTEKEKEEHGEPSQGASELRGRTLFDLAYREPSETQRLLLGSYHEFAVRIGERIAEFHLALAASTEPTFEPVSFSTMDQRSRYQSARNIVGRELRTLRRTLDELPASTRADAEHLLGSEDRILSRFEPLLGHRIDAMQIRSPGDLHLGRMLFTGKDYVLVGVSGNREQRHLSDRRRRGGALRDVASMAYSFHFAASISLTNLRPEDRSRAAPWSLSWSRWASAALLRGYLDTAKAAPFVPQDPKSIQVMLETGLLFRAFSELRNALRHHPNDAWIPIQTIAHVIDDAP